MVKRFDVFLLYQTAPTTPTPQPPPPHHPDYALVISRAGLRKEIAYMKLQRKTFNPLNSVSQMFLLADPFWLRKITMDPHLLAHVNIVFGWEVSKTEVLHLITDLI